MKTLYIHIGTPKTATTAIQDFLYNNQKKLKKRGYYYPYATKKYPNVSLRRNGHFLSGYQHGVDADIEENKTIVRAGMEKIKELFSKHDNIILTDESIWKSSGFQNKFLWKMLSEYAARDGYTIKIIVYLRRQDDYIMSIWNQLVKYIGVTTTWDEYFAAKQDAPVFKYYNKLKKIEKWFGKENIIVKRFDKQFFKNGNIFDDFMDVLGLEMSDKYNIRNETPNKGLLGNGHEIQRQLNFMSNLSLEEKRFLSSLLVKYSYESNDLYECCLMSKQEREEFLSKFKADNERIAEEFICDGKPLFKYDIPDIPKWTNDNPYLSKDLLQFNQMVVDEFMLVKRELDKMKDSQGFFVKFFKKILRRK